MRIGRIEDICSQLRKEIINRSIPPGTKLLSPILAKKFKVSRTPIREALRQLEIQGYISYEPNKGFIVNSISIDDVDQIYTIRISIEGLAGRLATPAISENPEKLKALEKLCREMEGLFKRGDMEGYLERNRQFHEFIWHSSENKWLIKILENLSGQLNRFIIKAIQVPHRVGKSVKEHWDIYKKFEGGDERAVEKALANHFRKSSEELKRELIKQE